MQGFHEGQCTAQTRGFVWVPVLSGGKYESEILLFRLSIKKPQGKDELFFYKPDKKNMTRVFFICVL